MQRPEEVTRSAAEGAALLRRLAQDTWTQEDRQVLIQILRMDFCLVCVVQEAKLSLKRLRTLLFGAPAAARRSPAAGVPPEAAPEQADNLGATPAGLALTPAAPPRRGYGHRPGQGRHGAQTSVGAQQVVCRHEELTVGQRCPVCGRGQL